jgi:hypothetical protein
MLLQITANHFCAGLGLINGHVVSCAPILHYMAGWTLARVREYAAGKGWTVTEVKTTAADQRWAHQTALRLGHMPDVRNEMSRDSVP